MSDMKSAKPGQIVAVSVVARADLTLMVCVGDQTLEIVLEPRAAMELAHSLLGFGLNEAERRSAARIGTAEAIERARDTQPH